jgi:hypothetical protein
MVDILQGVSLVILGLASVIQFFLNRKIFKEVDRLRTEIWEIGPPVKIMQKELIAEYHLDEKGHPRERLKKLEDLYSYLGIEWKDSTEFVKKK